jgi:hypothetical protein
VWPSGVVVGGPVADELAGLIEIDKQAFIEKFVTHTAIEGFDVAVLHRPTWCDVVPFDTMVLRPGQDRIRRELRSVIGDDHAGLAARIHEGRQLSRNSFARDRCVGDRCQTFAGHVVNDVKNAEAPAEGELIVDEVERPARIGLSLDQYRRSGSDGSTTSLALADG